MKIYLCLVSTQCLIYIGLCSLHVFISIILTTALKDITVMILFYT